jgi:hypothetical protein
LLAFDIIRLDVRHLVPRFSTGKGSASRNRPIMREFSLT